jgi:hypothetical protein
MDFIQAHRADIADMHAFVSPMHQPSMDISSSVRDADKLDRRPS